jgi:hypothetical protein
LLGAEGTVVERGLLPAFDYIVEGVEETALLAKDRNGAAARRSMSFPVFGLRRRYAPPGMTSWMRYGPSHGISSFDVLVCLRRSTRLPGSNERPRTRLLW